MLNLSTNEHIRSNFNATVNHNNLGLEYQHMHDTSVDIKFARELLEFLEAYNLFGEHLVISIEQTSITSSQLAKRLTVTPAAISQWCSGKRLPESGLVYRIAVCLEMNSTQRQSLLTAWTSTLFFRGYVPYLEEAISEKDLQTIQEILEITISHEEFSQENDKEW